MTKTEFDVKAMSDGDLVKFAALISAEVALRERQRKDEAIAKIRALAGEAGLSVSIDGARGRPGGRVLRKRPVAGNEKVAATS